MIINNIPLGPGRTYVIAEACSNILSHLSSLPDLVHQVRLAGADALKVQLFQASHFPLEERESKKKVEFPRSRFPNLVSLCHQEGIACGASVFDIDAIALAEDSGADFLKLATREYDNDDLNDAVFCSDLPCFWSYNYLTHPEEKFFGYKSTLPMLCIPEYPTANILMPQDMSRRGWSSHTQSQLDCIVAAARGAEAIEKHMSFNAADPEADWSLAFFEFLNMTRDIREVEKWRKVESSN